MKNSDIKKMIAVALATISLSTSAQFALAETLNVHSGGDVISPLNIAISMTNNNLSLGTLGKLSCYGRTAVQNGYIAGITVELQQYNGGWSTIKTWSDSNSNFVSISDDYYVTKGYNYRLKLTHKAYNRSWGLVESLVKYSNTVNYN